ncbi:hypothetical protein DJ79_13430 [Halorubrum ezzemoulense]|uniref:Uncharacterized protein n=1 Tax=Halorubrum ezzemoulense TaxID=337243 RepID=A0A256JBG8_HALEZ|nr:hypothetical protein [Halorubrum ezzemoulense]OYR60734.1 hypothetical protein DJ80_14675 [Halorubrum ezzemoulense]OYR66178.1 hypothetical protein DJ79_13430 [Halorubrum ezzemoulense]OYR74180.1 hypothetical protein DJ76_06570 [Halorubrum ezzemoulense]
MALSRSPREMLGALRSRLLIPAVIALLAGLGGIAFGLVQNDIVTVLGALLFLPSAALLFGIVAKRHGVGPFRWSSRRSD